MPVRRFMSGPRSVPRKPLHCRHTRLAGAEDQRMPARDHDIYASPPMRGLLADEIAALLPDLQRCAGTSALQISAAPGMAPPSLPMLGHWVRLHVNGGRYHGDLSAQVDEPLPFLADAFGLVLLRHATEAVAAPTRLLGEVARVVAPGGLLALTGVHPLSGWLPWWLWRARQGGLSLPVPLGLEGWLRGADFVIERAQRVGPPWPGVASPAGRRSLLGGGYLLLARKRRPATPAVRLKPRPLVQPVGSGLAPGARRGAAMQTQGTTRIHP
jgi:hypothetical protein